MIKTFPYLEISGSHQDIGLAIGEMFRGKIQEVIQDRKHYIKKYQEKLDQIPLYIETTKKVFPQYVEELQGMADGADIPFIDLFFHNLPEVYDHTLEWDREQAQTEDHCTVAVSTKNNGFLIGHNEDWAIESLDELYVLKATIGDTTFLGLNYATFLAGNAATINSWGLTQCINELHEDTWQGVGKYFIARAVCESKTLAEAENLIRTIPRASGYNHVLTQQNDLWDIEIAGPDIDIEKVSHQNYAHTNHFLSTRMGQYEKDEAFRHKNSYERLSRVKELVKNDMTLAEMQSLLGDQHNQQYPVCRERTIGSVIIETEPKIMHICFGPPNKGTFIPYSL